MAGLEFSVPYNNDPETLTELFKLKGLNGNCIREVYLSGPQQYSAAGRIVEEMDEVKFVSIVNRIHKEGLRVNLIMNPTCEGTEWYKADTIKAKIDFINRMHSDYGVEAVTIANPIYVREVRKRIPGIEICASVLADIDCVQRAAIFTEAGANIITPDANINRDLKLLKRIKEITNTKIKLMVNEGCLYKCPFRKFHFNYISHKSKNLGDIEDDVFFFNCSRVTANDHTQILKSGWIRPEDTSKYSEITNSFKIVGRERTGSLVIRATKAYLNESWDGDLLDIMCSSLNKYGLDFGAHLYNKSLSVNGFFEKITSCDRSCANCSFCDNLASKLIKLKVLTKGKLEDLGLTEILNQLEKQSGLHG
ncbi:U32 family peptidase [Chloroflexota bacterium]